jgi:carbon storage regulator
MLVIRRRAGQSILIGDDIEIEIIEVAPSRVKIGITAPKEVCVVRKEIRLTSEANRAAARGFSPERFDRLLEQFRRA